MELNEKEFCNGKSKYAYGYIWKYEEKIPIEDIINK